MGRKTTNVKCLSHCRMIKTWLTMGGNVSFEHLVKVTCGMYVYPTFMYTLMHIDTHMYMYRCVCVCIVVYAGFLHCNVFIFHNFTSFWKEYLYVKFEFLYKQGLSFPFHLFIPSFTCIIIVHGYLFNSMGYN